MRRHHHGIFTTALLSFGLLLGLGCDPGGEDDPVVLCSEDAECDDGNLCTDDACVDGECSNEANEIPCDDGNECTSGDRCSGGVCEGRPADWDRDGFIDINCGGDDCDDHWAQVNPEAAEGDQASCSDGLDNDCDGLYDAQEESCSQGNDEYAGAGDMEDDALRNWLENRIDGHDGLGYDNARDIMFSDLDNENGRVQCVYTGEWVSTWGIPDSDVMNTEHSWCQSWGADHEPAKSDLHHLFPAMMTANSRRGNLDYGAVVKVDWESGGSKIGDDVWLRRVFEVRDEHKGDAARALFYFAVRYDMPMGGVMEGVLREWHAFDPPDAKERARNDAIEDLQGNRNPFIDRVGFVGRISDF